ncbi:serine protease [Lithospermum erythrorhizon]|uniref:Serine protease n=1 Tax=Lithospermum erythrorhizon TaxID=34254 RepID=A0AAV3RDS3_LITER
MVSNLLVIDQPVGTGFSYAKTKESWKSSDTQSASLTYQFLKKWLVAHPEYFMNDLYIGGDSYGGMYATLVLEQVYNGNEFMGELPLNIKGYILGNPHADKFKDFNGRVDYAHHMGLLSDELYESAKSNCEGNYLSNIAGSKLCDHDMQRISQCLDNICMPHILDKCCDVWNNKLAFPSFSHGRDQLLSLGPLNGGWCQAHNFTYSYLWGNDEAVQEALNVRKGTIREWSRCNANIVYRTVGMERTEVYSFDVQSVIPIHRNLTYKHSRALVYR